MVGAQLSGVVDQLLVVGDQLSSGTDQLPVVGAQLSGGADQLPWLALNFRAQCANQTLGRCPPLSTILQYIQSGMLVL